MRNLFVVLAIILFSINKVSAQNMVAAKDAEKYTGKTVTICDKVSGEDNKAFVVILFIGGDYSNHLLRVVIRFSDRTKTKGYFDKGFKDKDICVTGVVQHDKAGAYIRVKDPSQIKPFMVDTPVKEPITTH